MDYEITAEDRARFKRCRRQWDFASPNRRNLVPPEATGDPALPAALKDALTVYYYPGTWDWPHELTQTLVHKACVRALDEVGAADQNNTGAALLDCYDAWAAMVDDFAPIKVGHDVHCLVPDPREPERGLMTPDGLPVRYTAQVDLLGVDSADEYWVVRHQFVDDWQDLGTLTRDEEALAACWAWEQDYIGMEIAGTMHNEIRLGGPLAFPEHPRAERVAKAVAQHEPSGGGRSIPQHVRVTARTARGDDDSRVEQRAAGIVRRTRIRRSRAEIAAVGTQLGVEALDMISGPAVYPNPAAHCRFCSYAEPCLVLTTGGDPEPLLGTDFRQRSVPSEQKPRLGQSTWGFGRGAAPPRW